LTTPLSIFLGYDSREYVAYQVAEFSIRRRTSAPILITPLVLSHLGHVMHRPIECRDGKLWCPISEAPMATEFAISRFCVPFLQREGWALFADCDILCLADIAELFALADPRYAVMLVKHQQESGAGVKMDNQAQLYYARKNWSSVVLWNIKHLSNAKLTIEALNSWPGRDLHAFRWLADNEIGELPPEWNHLVGVNQPVANPKLLHFTLGTPDMPGYENCEYADLWRAESDLASIA